MLKRLGSRFIYNPERECITHSVMNTVQAVRAIYVGLAGMSIYRTDGTAYGSGPPSGEYPPGDARRQ